jgi:hypothetical protein
LERRRFSHSFRADRRRLSSTPCKSENRS